MQPTCEVCGETILGGWDYCPACQHPYDPDGDPDGDDDADEDDDDLDRDGDDGEFFDDVGWGP